MAPWQRRSWQTADGADNELQADVMRFIAILALSIVAISTLVEEVSTPRAEATRAMSSPATDPESDRDPVREREVPPEAVPEVQTPSPERLGESLDPTQHKSVEDPPMAPASPVPPLKSVSARTGGAVPIPDKDADKQDVTRPEPRPQVARPTTRKGFTLRFETDAAMLRLVARGDAAVYVFEGTDALRLGFGPAGPMFAAAPQPRQFHAIAPETVPAILRTAFQDHGPHADDAVWGVTLPASTRTEIARILGAHDGGELIIRANGKVHLEQSDG